MSRNEIIKQKNLKINPNINIIDCNEYITSRIDGSKRKRIYGNYLKSLNLTSEEYKILFPDAPLYCTNDKHKTTTNSGLHMKTDKYKKIFSEKISGNKNPNHKSKTTDKQRKERSPFSKYFYDNDGDYKKFIENVNKNKKFNTQRNFYRNEHEYKNRQTTFSFDICIKKYGKEKGKEIFIERQKKWQESLTKNGNLKCGFSKISQELFDNLNYYFKNRIFNYATNNGEFKIKKENGNGIWLFDFTDVENKKIIEYNGDLFHANPKLFEKNDFPHPYRKELKSIDIWKMDQNKINSMKKLGYDILVVWDSEYRNSKDSIIKKCINFLNDNK